MNKEFTPIAMKCGKEQFKEIEPKLKKIGEIGKLTLAFENYKYLTNNYSDNPKKIIFDFISSETYWESEHQNNIHETWNEKVFLEACGIETEPEYVITHNFPSNKATVCDKVLNPTERKELFKMCFKFSIEIADEALTEIKNERFPYLGYSNISGDKITAFHVEKVSNNLYVSFDEFKAFIIGKGIIKNKNVEFKVGQWYKSCGETTGKLFCFHGKRDSDGDPRGYGFINYGETWMNNNGNGWGGNFELATPEEVTEALTKEAVKRGFVIGSWYKSVSKFTTGDIVQLKQGLVFGVGRNILTDGCCGAVFENGVWAEIIPTITKEDAEKELNKKII